RSGRPEPEAIARAIASAHAAGAELDWEAFFKGSGAQRVPLPTYPFQRERFWIAGTMGASDPTSIGQASAEHPLLGAAVEIAGEEGGNLLLTGRLSLATHPWLADHAVGDTVLLPGTAFLELALHAAERTGAERVAELTLQAPLVLPESGAVQIQVSVEAEDEQGQRRIAIHSRPEDSEEEAPEWTRHASGLLSSQPTVPPEPLAEWPPPGAEPIDLDSLYEQLADAGLNYGPAFQGLSAAWRQGEEILAEVSLADGQREEAQRFAIHPALLDSALHAAALTTEQEGISLPFSWSGVGIEAAGPSELRVVLRREGEAIGLDLSDLTGAPIASVGALHTRAISPEQLSARPRQDGLLGIEWSQVELPSFDPAATATVGEPELEGARSFESIAALAQAIEAGEPAPQAVLFQAKAKASKQQAKAARALTESALDAAQQWLSHESLAGSRLAFLTGSAVATSEEESPDLAAASLWGLLRSAQSEHPGRFALIDTDGAEDSSEALGSALAQTSEPQLALREGRALAPRLATPSQSLIPPPGPWRLDAHKRGSLEALELIANPAAKEPLAPNEVRVEIKAAGLNFRDVLIALGLYPGEAPIGSEAAGVVVEVGEEVSDLKAGERVMGMISDSFAPLAKAPREFLAPIPQEWSFTEAAAIPIAFLTARYGLGDLAKVKAGERVLVHA
ncbi:MAG TPA: polyketide synthase dehydratase domain-containing protein, partial [Solirubrobacterales bacterium]